jgi:hypothetical protein
VHSAYGPNTAAKSDIADDLGHVLPDEEMAGAGYDGRVAGGELARLLKPYVRRDKLVSLSEPQAHRPLDAFGLESPRQRHHALVIHDAAAARAGQVGEAPG